MFSLLKGLYSYYFQKPTIKILMIGLDCSGKTTLLNQLKSLAGQKCLPLDKITQTVGLNIARIDMGDNISLFWDLGGQSILRTIWKKYYSECHGVIFVVDGCDVKRMEEAGRTLSEVVSSKDLEGVPFLILLNKSDKAEKISDLQVTEKLAIENISGREIRIESVSAIQTSNLVDAIKWLNSAVCKTYEKTLK